MKPGNCLRLLLFSCVFHCCRAPPTVSITQSSYTVINGDNVTLECIVIPYSPTMPVKKVFWRRIVSGVKLRIISSTNTTKFSGSTTITPSLTIINAAQSDAGPYLCFADDMMSIAFSSPTTLVVLTQPPVVTVNNKTIVMLNKSDSITLPCNVDVDSKITLLSTKAFKSLNFQFSTGTGKTLGPIFYGNKTMNPGLHTCRIDHEGKVSISALTNLSKK